MNKQIFVIGRNRSGTKWISNILSNNIEISSIQRKGAGGILECSLLSHFPRHFNIKNTEDRSAFEILFKESNFHRCSGIDDKFLETTTYSSFMDFFEQYMNAVAKKEKQNSGCRNSAVYCCLN